jgi:hypothetical protein
MSYTYRRYLDFIFLCYFYFICNKIYSDEDTCRLVIRKDYLYVTGGQKGGGGGQKETGDK